MSPLLVGLALVASEAAAARPAPDLKWLVPIALFFLAQTGALLWWASQLTATVRFLAVRHDKLEKALDSHSDVITRLHYLEGAREDHEGRLRKLEGR